MRANHQSSSSDTPAARLSGFAASTLWHRRLDRIASLANSKVQPRVSAELVLRSVLHGHAGGNLHDARRIADAYRAA